LVPEKGLCGGGKQTDKVKKKQELRAHMALVMRSEEPRAKSLYANEL